MKKTLLAALAVTAAGAILPASLEAQNVPSLINVNLQNVLNDLAVKLNIDKTNIPVNAQVPVQVAANVCGVSVLSFNAGKTTCTATTAPQTLVQAVQQQMAAGGNATGGTGGSTGTTSGTPGSTSGGTVNQPGSTGGTTGGASGGTVAGTGGSAADGSSNQPTRNTSGSSGNATTGNTPATNPTTYRNRGQCQSAMVHMRNDDRKAGHTAVAKTCQAATINGRTVYIIK